MFGEKWNHSWKCSQKQKREVKIKQRNPEGSSFLSLLPWHEGLVIESKVYFHSVFSDQRNTQSPEIYFPDRGNSIEEREEFIFVHLTAVLLNKMLGKNEILPPSLDGKVLLIWSCIWKSVWYLSGWSQQKSIHFPFLDMGHLYPDKLNNFTKSAVL